MLQPSRDQADKTPADGKPAGSAPADFKKRLKGDPGLKSLEPRIDTSPMLKPDGVQSLY